MEDGYQVGERDVFYVLRAHGLADEADDMVVVDMLDVVHRHQERIDDAAAYGEDEEERMHFVLCEIEVLLIEAGHLQGERHFEMLEGVGA